MAELLQKQYGIPVTYEDSILTWRGDTEQTKYPNGKWGILPMSKSFSMPIEADLDVSPSLDSGLLNKVIDAYHMQTDGPHFKVSKSSWGFHLIPAQVRAAYAQFVEAKPPLDVHITVPIAKRTPAQHFSAICEAVTAAVGFSLEAFAPYINVEFASSSANFSKFRPTQKDLEKISFEWGVRDMVAREAVLNFIEHSSTTLSWMVLCDPTKPDCVFNMRAFEGGQSHSIPLHDREKKMNHQ